MLGFYLGGGDAVLLPGAVRFELWLRFGSRIPLDLVRVLDCAADLLFLRKVGSGYMFIHKTLQDFFASMSLETEA